MSADKQQILTKEDKKKTMALVGQRLKILRVYREMSQKDLADAVGYTQGFISGIEAGLRILPADMLIHIAKILHVDLSFFDPRRSIVLKSEELSSAKSSSLTSEQIT